MWTKEREKEYQRAYRQRNKAKLRAYHREYMQKHRNGKIGECSPSLKKAKFSIPVSELKIAKESKMRLLNE